MPGHTSGEAKSDTQSRKYTRRWQEGSPRNCSGKVQAMSVDSRVGGGGGGLDLMWGGAHRNSQPIG